MNGDGRCFGLYKALISIEFMEKSVAGRERKFQPGYFIEMKKILIRKIFSLFLVLTLGVTNISQGQENLCDDAGMALAPRSSFQHGFVGEPSYRFISSPLSEPRFLSAVFSIASHFLVHNRSEETLGKCIRDEYREDPGIVTGIDLDQVELFALNMSGMLDKVYRDGDVVSIPFAWEMRRYEAKIAFRHFKDQLTEQSSVPDFAIWATTERFFIKIEPDPSRKYTPRAPNDGRDRQEIIRSLTERGDLEGLFSELERIRRMRFLLKDELSRTRRGQEVLYDEKREYEMKQQDLIGLSVRDYDIQLRMLYVLGAFPSSIIYPCIGGDCLPSQYASVTGIALNTDQEVAEAWARQRFSKILGISEMRYPETIIADLSDEKQAQRLSQTLGLAGTILLKGTRTYIKESKMNDFLSRLTEKALKNGGHVVLFDEERKYEHIFAAKGFSRVELPGDLEDRFSRLPDRAGSYVEIASEDFDGDVVFWFPDSFIVMRKTQDPVDRKPGKGSIAEGLRALHGMKRGPVTLKEFKELRSYSRTTVLKELEMLEKLGLVSVDRSGREYRYSMPPLVREISPEIIETVCALPGMDRYEVSKDTIRVLRDQIKSILFPEVFAFDYDGTLAYSSERMTDSISEQLARLLINGRTVAVISGKEMESFEKFGIDIPGDIGAALERLGVPQWQLEAYLSNVFLYANKGTFRYMFGYDKNKVRAYIDKDHTVSFPEGYVNPGGIIREFIGTENSPGPALEGLDIFRVDYRQDGKGGFSGISITCREGGNAVMARDDIAEKLLEDLKVQKGIDDVIVETAGRYGIEITPVSKEYAVRDLLSRGYINVNYFGDEPEGNDRSIRALALSPGFEDRVKFYDVGNLEGSSEITRRILDGIIRRLHAKVLTAATYDALKDFGAVETPLFLLQEIRETMRSIHQENLSLTPPLEKGKVLWHVIPLELIPHSIRNDFNNMVIRINRELPHLREKISVVTERQDLNSEVARLLSDPDNIVDVAVTDRTQIYSLPKGVKALVFEGELGNFRHIEGLIASLRALHIEDVPAMLRLYKMLTGVFQRV